MLVLQERTFHRSKVSSLTQKRGKTTFSSVLSFILHPPNGSGIDSARVRQSTNEAFRLYVEFGEECH